MVEADLMGESNGLSIGDSVSLVRPRDRGGWGEGDLDLVSFLRFLPPPNRSFSTDLAVASCSLVIEKPFRDAVDGRVVFSP